MSSIDGRGDRAGTGAGQALAVLTLVNLLSYADRSVVPALAPSLGGSELHLDDFELGLLAPAFLVVYTLAAPLFGALGDRRHRPRLLAVGVALWSVASALGGFASSFGFLLAARAGVGVGEASYAAIAPAMLADLYPPGRRGRVFAIFSAAIPMGTALGYVVGGAVGQRFGWRSAFFVAGAPGLLLAWTVARLGDPPRGAQDQGPVAPVLSRSVLGAAGDLLRNGRYRRTVAAYAAYAFALGALTFWAPLYLVRVRGMSAVAATSQLGLATLATGLGGTLAGGWLEDRLRPRSRHAHLWVCGASTLLAAPVAAIAFTAAARAVYMPAIVVTELLLFMATGPINSAILDSVRPGERASAMALGIFAIHLLGDVPSTPLIGWMSRRASLQEAILVLPLAVALAGAIWLYAILRARREAGGELFLPVLR